MIHKVITYVEYRAVSGIFHNIDPPPPPTPLRECVLPLHQSRIGVHTRREVRGWGVNIWKTPDIGLAYYSIIFLRYDPSTYEDVHTSLPTIPQNVMV
jgi:hypothetical protein